MCDLETARLNGLMSRHWKKHCNDSYNREQYKLDLLTHNNRPPVICKFCQQETSIPKGEKEYPLYHKKCYLDNIRGSNNPNYKGGMVAVPCTTCDTPIERYDSQLNGVNKFCSASCSMIFYSNPINRTDKQNASDSRGRDFLDSVRDTDKCKISRANALAKMQNNRISQVENKVLSIVQATYPNAISQHVVDFYTFDIFIPETNTLIEVNGNYWHNKEQSRIGDRRKRNFIANNRSQYTVHTIWESEISTTPDNLILPMIFSPVKVFILAGPNGCGKTYLGQQLSDKFDIIDYDSLSLERCIAACKVEGDKPKLLITPIQAKRIMKELRASGIRVWSVYLREDTDLIKSRLLMRGGNVTNTLTKRIARYESLKDKFFEYYGSQEEIRGWLTANPYL
jgi:very-short-patch-repair endonuclease